jgi:hypothetical protein
MADGHLAAGEDDLPLLAIPKTALQAIYHAVTGKTENLERILNGNVEVNSIDFDRLHDMIIDQIGVYNQEIEPTVTVVLKQKDDQVFTYSSWARYKKLLVNSHQLTSEITLKIETLLKLPNTPSPQRCTININIDSSLPVISKHFEEEDIAHSMGFLFVVSREWQTVKINIDFVDFLVAKSFVSVVEEWFFSLNKTPDSKLNQWILKKYDMIRTLLGQVPRIGFAFFVGSFAFFSEADQLTIFDIFNVTAFGLIIWSMLVIFENSVGKKSFRRVSANIIPSVILITDGDSRAYQNIKDRRNSPITTFMSIVVAWITGILINLISSYIYSYLNTP